MDEIRIDLYSDTHTKPTAEMRRFMSNAEVGDEQQQADPTVNRLVQMVCELLGKEDAIYLPSGTMCNQIAWRVYCRAGDELIMDTTAHTRHFETGGPAALSGAMVFPLEGKRGIFSADQFKAAIRPENRHFPRSRAVLIEQTSNLGGGSIWPLETIREICAIARENGLACHMDGARLLNAVVASGVSAKEYASYFDSVWIDFSKGLGAPVGAALAGSKQFIDEAWRWKHQFGGAMRQAGIIAAGAVYALTHHVERLAEDHENARFLYEGLARIEGIEVDPPQTNMVFFDIAAFGISSERFAGLLAECGLSVSTIGATRVRAVTHLDVTRSHIEEALDIIRKVVAKIKR
ncbi:MAG: threonine aldolase family protein [Deltaproteobacteria bacterium]|nr:threonine aldolase family protein [Deltaproteobacteria bacterium]MBW1959905.1 threonine aldolase family protein [Deltaproteobacteria bacterium]MBW1993564.1 threonine aldolase family protein [Deltaproteobacteria bacterium]MBW2150419.1 threonine aldolase family protein [Deltaproteobacteria bacterium]